MASCSSKDEQSEKNRKNANILKNYMFRHDIIKVIHFGFQFYTPGKHNEMFIKDLISFTHVFLEHLEKYSKGKVLMVKTNKKKKVKKQKVKNTAGWQNSGDEKEGGAAEKEYNPDAPDDFSEDDDQQNGEFYDEEMDEESDREENVERQFNFVGEIALLVDY